MKSVHLLMILLFLHTILASQTVLAQQSSINSPTINNSNWQPLEGEHYLTLQSQTDQSTPSVIEFYFWPGSASCYQLELALQKWQLANPTIEVQRIPLVKRPSWRLLSKAWLTAVELNLADNFLNQLYHTIHQQSKTIKDNAELEQFLQSLNIDVVSFMSMFNSTLINQKLRSIELSNQLLPLQGVPSIVINKKWLSDASMVTTSAHFLSVIEHLSPKLVKEQ